MSTPDKPLTIAVLGGDKRELIIARLFRDRGHNVRLWGTRASEELAPLLAPSLAGALDGAEVLVTPMPGVAGDYSLYAPHAPEPILLDEATLAPVSVGARYFGGRSTQAMHAAGAVKQIIWSDMAASRPRPRESASPRWRGCCSAQAWGSAKYCGSASARTSTH
jgi:hypothetical protein